MDSKQLLGEGRLTDAIAASTARVKANPADTSARIALFEMLCFQGDLVRASKQLDVVGGTESIEFAYAVTILKKSLAAAETRRKVLAGHGKPEFLGEDQSWAGALLAAIRNPGSVSADAIDDARPKPRGTINGQEFSDLRDGDDLLAPIFELFASGRYVWLEWKQIKKLTSEPPKTLRDTIWLPVNLELSTGDRCEGLVPVLYSGSHTHEDEKVRLGLATDWAEEDGLVRGKGRRVLYANGEEVDILGIRELAVEA